MVAAQSFFSMTYNDNTINQKTGQPENGTFEVAVGTLTSANVAAQLVKIATLVTAVEALVIGVQAKNAVIFDRNVLGAGPAASVLAQRENKWLCRYHGATTFKKFRVSIPTADLTLLPATNTEFLDLTAGAPLAFKTAFEDIITSPDDGAEAVILDSVQFVGRNT